MSDDLRTRIVDADCKAHVLNNLYIAGSSVFAAALEPWLLGRERRSSVPSGHFRQT
jgi:hypothetical protein